MLPPGAPATPTEGFTVTAVDADGDGPLHPDAVTLTVAGPVNPAAQVTVPVVPVPLMVPALVGLIDQL